MAEKFRYYVVFSFINDQGRLRMTCRFIDRDSAVETSKDIQDLSDSGAFADFQGITVINWKRIQ